MRKTKIICTLGPATDDREVLRQLMLSGMDVARINFSHGSHEEHLVRINMVKELRKELGLPIALLLDTKGPEIRTGDFKDGKAMLKDGTPFTLTTRHILGDDTQSYITFENLPREVETGNAHLNRRRLNRTARRRHDRHRHPLHRHQRRPGLEPQGHQRPRLAFVPPVFERAG